jgi:hypothetical protein
VVNKVELEDEINTHPTSADPALLEALENLFEIDIAEHRGLRHSGLLAHFLRILANFEGACH